MESLLGVGGIRRHRKSSRLIALSKLAISRVAVLKNQRRLRSSVARSDVIQLLHLGHQHRALLRAELVIKEQNMFDALSMIEGYCNILSESISLLEKNHMEVSDDLKEAIASLMFAAPRCGEFPELREICRIIWKQFTASALQIHNNSNYTTVVSLKIIRKLTLARQPSSGSRLMALKEIASENGIQLLQYTTYDQQLNSKDIESDQTNGMMNEQYEAANDEDENNEDAVDESSSRSSDLEKRDHHHIQASNDILDHKVDSQLGDSLGSSNTITRHLSRQNGRVLERKHRNTTNIVTQGSNNVTTYTGVAVGSDY